MAPIMHWPAGKGKIMLPGQMVQLPCKAELWGSPAEEWRPTA